MNRLTPELWAHSAVGGTTPELATRELDFNLSRRSAILINHVVGQCGVYPDVTAGFDLTRAIVQELDVDPDNVDTEFAGVVRPSGVVYDSSRVFRQVIDAAWDTAAGATGSFNQVLQRDWTTLPMVERPMSITNVRHHVKTVGTISCYYMAELAISYYIVELTLEELGILNASRR